MSTRVSSATNLSATYFMRNFYSNNRDAMKSSKRKEYSITELAYDDSTALHRAAKKLKNYKYSDDENTDNIRGTVMALVDTYNNSIDSASNSSSFVKSSIRPLVMPRGKHPPSRGLMCFSSAVSYLIKVASFIFDLRRRSHSSQ